MAVLLSPNIVRMAFYLVLSLAATSGLFFLAGQDFVGAMQLLIYVGGTLVLLVFGVMLTSQERFVSMKTMAGDWVIGLFAGGALLFFMVLAAVSVPEWQSPDRGRGRDSWPSRRRRRRSRWACSASASTADQPSDAPAVGYLLHFEIVSVHLLVVLVGAAYLARAKRKASAPWAVTSGQ